MRKALSTYGKAGGPGQGLSRFEVEGDPTPYIPLWASGSLVTTSPAHMMGNDGSPYKYGTLVLGGNRNLINYGDVVYPLPMQQAITGNGDLYLGGGTFLDVRADAAYGVISSFEQGTQATPQAAMNGELVVRQTNTTDYGSAQEPFTTAGTVTIVNGSNIITGAGSTWTVDVLTGGYGYTPQMAKIQQGDIIGVGAAGARAWYRIVSVTDNTHLVVYPPVQQANAAGLAYTIRRTGYGSYSRVIVIPSGAGLLFRYYAGSYTGGPVAGQLGGAIQASGPSLTGFLHFMAPQSTATADFPAQDIAYYKSFLLYGAGSAIGWSVAGFPTAFPFGATDFPAGNISVIDPTDTFVTFEFLGDQLIACFQSSMWLVQATGIIPEFAFYKLPEPVGVITQAVVDPELGGSNLSTTRPSCSARASIFYVGESQVMQLTGGISKPISEPIKSLDALLAPNKMFTLSWDGSQDSVLIRPHGPGGKGIVYQVDRGRWYPLDLTPATGQVFAMTFGPAFYGSTQEDVGVPRILWLGTDAFIRGGGKAPYADVQESNMNTGWIWPTPILCLSEVYPSFKFGGFQVWARAALGAPPTTLTWTIYGGSDPYHMNVRQGPSTFDYATGFVNSRNLLGSASIDDAFIGFVLSGNSWIELAGLAVFSSESQARR